MSFVNSSSQGGSSATPSVAVPNGAGATPLQADDIVYLAVATDRASDTLSGKQPAGFNLLDEQNVTLDGQSAAVFWKRLTGADTGTYTFSTLGSSTAYMCVAWARRGRHTTNPPVISTAAVNNSGNSSPVTVTANGQTLLAGDDFDFVSMPDVNTNNAGTAHVMVTSGYTEREDAESGFMNAQLATSDNRSAGATGSVSSTFTMTGGTAGYVSWTIRTPTASAPNPPAITDVDTDETITSTQTNVVITGTDFDTATVEIRQGSTIVAQSIDSQNSTTIQFDVVFDAGGGPHLKYGAATLAVINGDDQEDTIDITIDVPSGRSFVDLGVPNTTAGNRITAAGDLATGDQLELSNIQGGTIADLTVFDDSTFDVDEGVTDADARAWDVNDSTWGSVGTQSFGDAGQVVAVGLNTETDSAFAVVATKAKAVGLNTETDSALALSSGRTVAVGLADETDVPLALTFAKAKAVGLITETDASLTATVVRGYAVGLATETDSAFSVTKLRAYIVGLATEFDSALALQGQVVSSAVRAVRRGATYLRLMFRRG